MAGVYGLPDLPDRSDARRDDRKLWRVTGNVSTCEKLYEGQRKADSRPDEPGTIRIVFVPGRCHYWSGGVILAQEAELLFTRWDCAETAC